MLALKKKYDRPGLWRTDEAPIPRIGPRDVLVAVTHAGICGTDRHIYEWDAWSRNRVPLGLTTGHEFVGRVVQVGEAVERCEVGNRVSAEGHVFCGRCRPCQTGNAHICEEVEILGIDRDGCFAQYVAVPEQNIWPVHPRIPDHVAAVFDPLGNAMHTVMAAGVSGKSVLITGVGIIGLMAVTIARAAGAARIIVTDVDPRRLEIARRLGADEGFDARDQNWPHDLRRTAAPSGPQVLLEMSGHPQAIRKDSRRCATAAWRRCWVCRQTGFARSGERYHLQRRHSAGDQRPADVRDLVPGGGVSPLGPPQPGPDHHAPAPLADFETGFRLMQTGEAIKVVLAVPQESAPTCRTPASTTAAVSCSLL
jgi:threonine 3-dehydrogenase